jgi:hypothetical protein
MIGDNCNAIHAPYIYPWGTVLDRAARVPAVESALVAALYLHDRINEGIFVLSLSSVGWFA